ncbi:helix-turn-helix transcriptional regulator [Flavobacteriaceae bacterium S0825]|uniref:helix-turn-helix domain-containing protein n=1 Tax=Gaetbulibacter sp. S0825 TaxID=2720084 RepID=UPI0014312C5F|nr:helix-turn-helix transcriptional regulator [Gaetbulibacter sp. S0825]MCK0107891.1 helix-turn-helix transcriptional regulator [Flavobacteriaceae bacterium S0825]NIX63527.1 helix-turn-helix transcriptional regulator [Gaetbulibacter sp. S0825]
MKFIGNTNEYLQFMTLEKHECTVFSEIIEGSLTILWFQGDVNELVIDGKIYTFNKNQIVFLTEFHKVAVNHLESTRFLRFNRPFYCVIDHDTEVGCKGLLFFGASQLPIITIPEKDHLQFETLWTMFSIEMQSKDNLQIDMLQMMLKRYLILCTRLFKAQFQYPEEKMETDIVREFNFLVEQYFKTKHTVAEYAELLNKSPKTLSNIFSKLGSKTPLQYIHDRKMLEARRRLRYTNMQIQEIAYEIGYEDIQAFSRFFKKQEGVSPSLFKENL